MRYRSKFELTLSKLLSSIGTYESKKVPYTIPESYHTYTPDWIIETEYESIWIEAKGKLDLATQKKMKFIRAQYPNQRIVFIFQNENNVIRKGSKTTYRMWAEKNNFEVVSQYLLPQQIKKWKKGN